MSCVNIVPANRLLGQPPADGQVLWLRADLGIQPDFMGGVGGWDDQSGNGLHARSLSQIYLPQGTESPVLIENAVNGHPAVRFDGVDDVLEIPWNPLLSPGEGSWTVVIVAQRLGRGTGDFPQIIGSRPWLAGNDMGWNVSLDAEGRLASHYADGTVGHDVPQVRSVGSLSDSAFEMWIVEEDLDAAKTRFYRQGDLDQELTTTMPVEGVYPFDPAFIGREMGGADNRRAQIDIAEIIIYNRIVNETERMNLSLYLSDRYDFGFVANQPPVVALISPDSPQTVEAPGEIVVEAEASDPDGVVVRVEFLANGFPVGVALAPPFRMPVRLPVPGDVEIQVLAVDDRGAATATEPVWVTVTGEANFQVPAMDELVLWLRADEGVTADFNGVVWLDQSGLANHASQIFSFEAPEWVADAGNGRPAFRFDGVDDYLEIANHPSMQPGNGSWNVIFVGRRNPGSMGDFPQVIGSRPWVAGLDLGWAVSYRGSDGFLGSHYADGTSGHDVPQILSAAPLSMEHFQIWQVEEDRPASQTRFYRDGSLDAVRTVVMPSGPLFQEDPVYIGREIGGANNRRASMDLAEVLIYPRVLSDEERGQLHSTLAIRYGQVLALNGNQPPTGELLQPEAGSVWVLDRPIPLEAAASDTDGAVVLVEVLSGNRVLASWNQPPYLLETDDIPFGDIILAVRITDNLGSITLTEAVPVTILPPVDLKPMQLIGETDYSDSFTVGISGDPSAENPRPNGMYNDNSFAGYDIENSHGNPVVTWTPTSNFSFNVPGNTTGPDITLAAAGNAGADTGLAQSGGGDFSIPYGLRTRYVVQVDAILPLDRLDVGSYAQAGDGIGIEGGLTVFFRRDEGTAPGIALYNGNTETAVVDAAGVPVRTGIQDSDWHQFAVYFDGDSQHLGVYIDGFHKTTLDLRTFADGIYENFSNGAVGIGGAGFNGVHAQWFDNFAVGSPSLVGIVDYSDTFTVGPDGEISDSNPRPNGMYNNNTFGGYDIENTHGNPVVTWTPTSNFSFNVPGNTTGPDITLAAVGNPGAETGIAQSGGGDFNIAYGLRDRYVVRIDAILPLDRLDIGSYPSAGSGIGDPGGLTVFLRREGSSAPGIGLYNGEVETEVPGLNGLPASTGIEDLNWHRFAVDFDRGNGWLEIFVNGSPVASVDLNTFADGIYRNFSNGAVGVGGAGFDGTHAQWFDNFLVGAPGPSARPDTASIPDGNTLRIRSLGGVLMIEWDGSATLESAPTPQGPWNPVPAAESPWQVQPEGEAQFYRSVE